MSRGHVLTLASALAWVVFFGVTLVLPTVGDRLQFGLQLVSILFGVILLMGILLVGEQPCWTPAARWALFIAGALLIVVPYVFNLRAPSWRMLIALGILAVALPVGYWIGDRLERVTNLVPLAVAMSMADIFSVYQGPSREVVAQIDRFQTQMETVEATVTLQDGAAAASEAVAKLRAPFVDYIVVHFPVAGTGGTVPVLGIGDFIVLAFLFRAAWLHGISPLQIFWAAFISLIAALVTGGLLHQAIPALPFIALGTVGYLCLTNPRMRRLDRQELVLSLVVAALFGALILGKWILGVTG